MNSNPDARTQEKNYFENAINNYTKLSASNLSTAEYMYDVGNQEARYCICY